MGSGICSTQSMTHTATRRIGQLNAESLKAFGDELRADQDTQAHVTYTKTDSGYAINFAGVTIGHTHKVGVTWLANSSDLLWTGSPIQYLKIATTGQEHRSDTTSDLMFFIAETIAWFTR